MGGGGSAPAQVRAESSEHGRCVLDQACSDGRDLGSVLCLCERVGLLAAQDVGRQHNGQVVGGHLCDARRTCQVVRVQEQAAHNSVVLGRQAGQQALERDHHHLLVCLVVFRRLNERVVLVKRHQRLRHFTQEGLDKPRKHVRVAFFTHVPPLAFSNFVLPRLQVIYGRGHSEDALDFVDLFKACERIGQQQRHAVRVKLHVVGVEWDADGGPRAHGKPRLACLFLWGCLIVSGRRRFRGGQG
mmetsp:Transcript_39754/g.100166  ORF Transcript_39754/g.100166 Transcript_39754/m.100166 type:complete len:243 (-) Transcript_39754:644-1372(-)